MGEVQSASVPVVVRPARPSDAQRLMEVARAANTEYAGRWALGALSDHLLDVVRDLENGFGFVALADGLCVGTIRCVVHDDGTGYLKRLAVLPGWRRFGIGTRLMIAAEDYLLKCGVVRATLCSVAENASATAFYRSRGYRVVELREDLACGFTASMWEKNLRG